MPKSQDQLQIHNIHKSKIAIKKKKWNQLRRAHINKQRKVNIGTWRLKETISYIQFLQTNIEALDNVAYGQKSKLYTSMASFIKTRTSLQCRSHHQKMINTHKSLAEIIKHYTKTVIPFFQREQNKLRYEKYLDGLKKAVPLYKITINMNKIRIQIDQKHVRNY